MNLWIGLLLAGILTTFPSCVSTTQHQPESPGASITVKPGEILGHKKDVFHVLFIPVDTEVYRLRYMSRDGSRVRLRHETVFGDPEKEADRFRPDPMYEEFFIDVSRRKIFRVHGWTLKVDHVDEEGLTVTITKFPR